MPRPRASRRSFLRSTSAGAAALAWPGSRILGANDRLNVGCIGVGGRGTDLLQLVLSRAKDKGDVRVVAVCDVYQRRLEEALGLAEGANPFTNHRHLLGRTDVDAVIVATPDHWHGPITLGAFAAGKDVYCEKPMTSTLEESREVARAAKASGRILQVGVQSLSWSKWWKAREAIAKGMLGKIVACQGTYSRNQPQGDWNYYTIDPKAGPDAAGSDHIDWEEWLGPAPKRPYDADRFFRFRKYWDYSGGIATDLHYHTVAPFHVAVANEHPTRVVGMGGIWAHADGREVPDTFLTAADYPGKYSLTVQSSQANAMGPPTLIRGEKATMFCGPDWEGEAYGNKPGEIRIAPEKPFREEFRRLWGRDEVILEGAGNEGDLKHMDDFLDSVRSRREPHCGADLAFKVMTSIALSVRSYREGRMFYFDPAKEEAFAGPPAHS